MSPTYRALFCGDREWGDHFLVREKLIDLKSLHPDVVMCHGDAPGADRISGTEANALGISVTKFPADWGRLGVAAGPIRNRQMLREFAPDVVYAFHDDLDASKGTADMVKIARAAGIPVVHCFHEEPGVPPPTTHGEHTT